MKLRTLTILALSTLCMGCAHQDDWTRQDTIGQILVTAALAGDAITTSRIKDCIGCYEKGPVASRFLGSQPDSTDTAIYFATNAVLNYMVARALPAKWRPYWQAWEVGVHAYAVKNNCDIGLC